MYYYSYIDKNQVTGETRHTLFIEKSAAKKENILDCLKGITK